MRKPESLTALVLCQRYNGMEDATYFFIQSYTKSIINADVAEMVLVSVAPNLMFGRNEDEAVRDRSNSMDWSCLTIN